MQPAITIVVPCSGRPQRTRRMIECILNQDIENWEAFIIGDNCPDFHKLMHSTKMIDYATRAVHRKSTLYYFNQAKKGSGFGYQIINYAIEQAKGDYFIFAGNDDYIQPDHFRHYLSGIKGTDLDFVYYNTWVEPNKMPRMAQPIFGSIGHSELIIRTSFLKKMPAHGPEYGHDWKLVEDMIAAGGKHKKITDELFTYIVKSVPGKTEQGIID